jgi:D-xylose transport system permease protein
MSTSSPAPPSESSISESAKVPADAPASSSDWRRLFSLREMGVYYALILLVLVLSVATAYGGRPNYLSVLNVTNVLYQSSLTAIMAVAMTVILITGNFDLSVASVAALSAAVLIGTADAIGFWPSVGAAMGVAVAAGLLNGVIVQLLGINAFIVTLGTLTAIRGVVLLYTNGHSLSVSNPGVIEAMRAFEQGRLEVAWPCISIGVVLIVAAAFVAHRARGSREGLPAACLGMALGGICLFALGAFQREALTLPKPVIYMAIYAAIIWFALTFTTIGRRVYAVGGNAEAARLSGINVGRYKMGAFILCSAAAGFVGVLFASRLRSINPAALQGAELTVIASAILGGTSLYGGAGSVAKTIAGALLLFTLTNGFNILNLGANYQGIIEGTVVVAAAAIYTVGSAGRRK